ncbi:MAG: hypothetical protein QG575_164 [Euryarchaeota archaeon]|nr:hypothetical protein [Euryarchaeota archaeon]
MGSTPSLNLAALYDHGDGAMRCIVGPLGRPAIEETIAEFDSGDPKALLEAVHWSYELCPAERYALVLWSHGSGWSPKEIEKVARQARGDGSVSENEAAERSIKSDRTALFRTTLARVLQQNTPAERAICFDDGTQHALDTLQLEQVAKETQNIIDQPLDLLGMDACLMANLEVAYQLRDNVRYLVASEELVPGYSWPYNEILGALNGSPDMQSRDLAALVVQYYADYYTKNPPGLNNGDVTKVALDLSLVKEIAKATNDFARAILDDLGGQAKYLSEGQYATRERETLKNKRKRNKFMFHLWDLNTLALYMAEHSPNSDVKATANAIVASLQQGGAVVTEKHQGNWFEGIGGVSIYAVPPGVQRISPYYEQIALSKDTCWNELLKAYHEAFRGY